MLELFDLRKFMGLPVVASEHGDRVDSFIVYVHWMMLLLFVGWLAFFVYTLIRFRASRSPKADYVGVRGHFSNYLEGAVALAEAGLLIFLAIPLWAQVVEKFPPEQEAVSVRVIAQQFAWNIRYPGKDGVFGKQDLALVTATNRFGLDMSDPQAKDDIEMINEIHLPVNKPAILHVTSMDVVHSFKVIAFRLTQDAIPGLSLPIWFVPNREGKYQINCAQLCGNGHYSMSAGFVTVESQEKFDQWIAAQKTAAAGTVSFE